MKPIDVLKKDFESWMKVTQALNDAKKNENIEFNRLRTKLKLNPELGNRDVIVDALKRAIADEVLK